MRFYRITDMLSLIHILAPATKADEIFTELLGKPVYNELAEAGYVFGEIKIGE